MHPARLPLDQLLDDCTLRNDRRSGPGGQHRNKVQTAVVIEHRGTGIRTEANERRSQAANRSEAIFRLRMKLALVYRSPWTKDGNECAAIDSAVEPSPLWQSRTAGGRIVVSDQHDDFPALLAEALDHLAASHWNNSIAADRLRVKASQLVKLLRLSPAAIQLTNTNRRQMGLSPLR